MATRVNRAATAGNKKGGKSNRRNRSVKSFNTHEDLDSPRNQRVFRAHNKESKARRHQQMAGEEPDRIRVFQKDRGINARPRVPRVEEVPAARPKWRRKKKPSGRGISGNRIYVVASGDRPKPKRSGWSRG
jgi:hypothetical protein